MSLVANNAMRASFCRALIEHGVGERAAYFMMGHVNPAMVQRVYNGRGRNSQAHADRIQRLNRRTEAAVEARADNVIPIRAGVMHTDYSPTIAQATFNPRKKKAGTGPLVLYKRKKQGQGPRFS